MKRLKYLILASMLVLSGCIVRTYEVTKDRVDQDLTVGNRGYLKGEASGEVKERKSTRATRVVEIEMFPPIKFEKAPEKKPVEQIPLKKKVVETEDRELTGNRGFIIQSTTPEILEPEEMDIAESEEEAITSVVIQRYTVQAGDTLQKISKKFYGTTRKWTKIYEANADNLKGPDKLYPGQVINIPMEESAREPAAVKEKIK